MGVRRNPIGPLRNATLKQIKEVVFWDKTRPVPVTPQDDDADHIVRIGDRADNLAFQKLENEALDHILMERNDLRLWPNDFVPGRRIAIPTRDGLDARRIV
jgi:hypothetical protein